MDHGARPLRSTRRLANQNGQRPGWYRITNSTGPGPAQVSIYDEIGFMAVSAADFAADIKNVTGDLELHINSPGGDVFEGLAIFNTLKQRTGEVSVIVDGIAASAASFIAQAASPGKLAMAPHSQMMIHDGFGMAIGNAADMRQMADLLDKTSDNIAGIYADRTGKPVEHWREQMKAETWMSDSEAVAEGLADTILGQESNAANGWDLSVFAHYAGSPANSATPAVANGEKTCAEMGHQCCKDAATTPVANAASDMHGDHKRADPDGDGDCDACPEGDTDHDYWSQDGKQLKPLPGAEPGNRATFPILNADFDSSPWDASKAWHNGAESDDPAAFYKGICAGRKSGDPSTQDAWALPYKYHPGDKPNAAGVKAALGRLPQTQGLTNSGEAKSLLQKLMKQINPDYDPEDHIDVGLLAEVFAFGLEGAGK